MASQKKPPSINQVLGIDPIRRNLRQSNTPVYSQDTMSKTHTTKRDRFKCNKTSLWTTYFYVSGFITLVFGLLVLWRAITTEDKPEYTLLRSTWFIWGLSLEATAYTHFFLGWITKVLSNSRWLSSKQLEYQIKTFELLDAQNRLYESELVRSRYGE